MYYEIESVNLNSINEINSVTTFLNKFNLKYERIDYTIIIKDNDKIIATCSKYENVIKCFAIDKEYQGMGISNSLISNITQKLFLEGIYHSFIFTKAENKDIFESLGYKNVFTTDKVSLLENGNKSINTSLLKLSKKYKIDNNKYYASIVMNCNPFTLGHRYLIEKASKENENVIIFIVEEDKSIFPFKIRYEIVKDSVRDLENVIVIPGGKYIISSATFPNYFLKQNDNILKEYTKLDCNIFGKYFSNIFNIKKRYVGSEDNCKVTNIYNETLVSLLPKYDVEVEIVSRKKNSDEPISASKVRELIKENNMEKVKSLVPKTTFDFLTSKEGEKVINRL